MKYAIDASVALKWVLPEIDSDKAIRLLTAFQAGVHELMSPDVFPIEVSNSLARAERNGAIPTGVADIHLTNILSTSPRLHPYQPILRRALAIACSARHGIYDCVYVALVEREGCELVTADDRLIKKLGVTFRFIVSLSSMP
jgi:predicted nucleic acid-binding protein